MATLREAEVTPMSTKERPKLSLSFPLKGDVQPKGFENATVNAHVTVIVKGRVSSISEKADEWDPGKRFSLDMKSCEIVGPEKKVSLDIAIKETRQKV
jgi:hypothetical protein